MKVKFSAFFSSFLISPALFSVLAFIFLIPFFFFASSEFLIQYHYELFSLQLFLCEQKPLLLPSLPLPWRVFGGKILSAEKIPLPKRPFSVLMRPCLLAPHSSVSSPRKYQYPWSRLAKKKKNETVVGKRANCYFSLKREKKNAQLSKPPFSFVFLSVLFFSHFLSFLFPSFSLCFRVSFFSPARAKSLFFFHMKKENIAAQHLCATVSDPWCAAEKKISGRSCWPAYRTSTGRRKSCRWRRTWRWRRRAPFGRAGAWSSNRRTICELFFFFLPSFLSPLWSYSIFLFFFFFIFSMPLSRKSPLFSLPYFFLLLPFSINTSSSLPPSCTYTTQTQTMRHARTRNLKKKIVYSTLLNKNLLGIFVTASQPSIFSSPASARCRSAGSWVTAARCARRPLLQRRRRLLFHLLLPRNPFFPMLFLFTNPHFYCCCHHTE